MEEKRKAYETEKEFEGIQEKIGEEGMEGCLDNSKVYALTVFSNKKNIIE